MNIFLKSKSQLQEAPNAVPTQSSNLQTRKRLSLLSACMGGNIREECSFNKQRLSEITYSVRGENSAPKRYFDTTATALPFPGLLEELTAYAEHCYASSHTSANTSADTTTESIESARGAVLKLLGCDPALDEVIFWGTGTTDAANVLAQLRFPAKFRDCLNLDSESLAKRKAKLSDTENKIMDEMIERPMVMLFEDSHHANLLPFSEAVGKKNTLIIPFDSETGQYDETLFNRYLNKYGDQLSLICLTGTSNVTGISKGNEIERTICERAHEAGAKVYLDWAAKVPHERVEKRVTPDSGVAHKSDVDYAGCSAHKFGGLGVGILAINKNDFPEKERLFWFGGGMVKSVTADTDKGIQWSPVEHTERFEPGTPNIPGIIMTGLVAVALDEVIDDISKKEEQLTRQLLHGLSQIPGVQVLGNDNFDETPRTGVISFAVRDSHGEILHHDIVARYLSDAFNIMVRSGCFCAQPAVAHLLDINEEEKVRYLNDLENNDHSHLPGAVRASIEGLHLTNEDIDFLITAVREIVEDADKIRNEYTRLENGKVQRKDGKERKPRWNFADAASRMTSKAKQLKLHL